MQEKVKISKIFLFFFILILTVIYTYYIRNITDDELYNYGYIHNIITGLIPYKDFSMIVPPLFFYLCTPIFLIFGEKLIIYHIVIAFLTTTIFFITSKQIGYKALAIEFLILFYPYAGYNIFSLFLLFLLLSLRKKKFSSYLTPIIIIFMFLTKQTFALLIIPSLLETKNRKKTVMVYLVGIFLFLLYLIVFNNFNQFLNYCFLGMLSFTKQNKTPTSILFWIEILIIFYFLWNYHQTKDIETLYILIFQIIVFPIADFFHFCIGIAPVTYFLILKERKYPYISFLIFLFFAIMALTLHVTMLFRTKYEYLEYYPQKNFMYSRLVSRNMIWDIEKIKKVIKENPDSTLFFLGTPAYFIKLNLNLPINKFDNINDGNLGYHGEQKYREELQKKCQNNSCLFIFDDTEATGKKKSQTNRFILNYIKNNYNQVYSSSSFDIYKSERN